MGLILASVLAALLPRAASAAGALPPDLMSYQGYLVDGNGNPLAPSAPANYPVAFRIFASPTGGAVLWSEQQIVTVDKGSFSVVLGEGTSIGAEPRAGLSTVFSSDNASSLFLGISVTLNTSTLEILPRLRLLTSPYAFLATSALRLVQPSGASAVDFGNNRTQVTGDLSLTGIFRGNGSGITNLVLPTDLPGNRTFGGNVGIGTTTPGVPLVIGNNTLGDKISLWGQSGATYGFGIQAATLQIHTDAPGSAIAFGYGSSGSFTERMRLTGDGNLAIGGADASALLQINGGLPTSSGGEMFRLRHGFAGAVWGLEVDRDGTLYFRYNGARVSRIFSSGGYNVISDRQLKRDIRALGSVLDKVDQLRPVSYGFKQDSEASRRSMGFIAQEVEPLFPDAVSSMGEHKGLSYSDLIPVAIGAIQELHTRVRERDSQIEDLRARSQRVSEMEIQLDGLKRRIAESEAASARLLERFSALERLAARPGGSELTPSDSGLRATADLGPSIEQ